MINFYFEYSFADMALRIPKSFGSIKSDKKNKDGKGDGVRFDVPKAPIPQPPIIL